LILNYGLGWSIDRNLNYDLHKPTLLAPILGPDGLGPTRKQWRNFSPLLGLAWSPSPDGKTVVRAGGGIFYDFLQGSSLDPERAILGPPGLGRQTFSGTSILNTLSGVPGVPVGWPLDFRTPTLFTGANLMTLLPAIRAGLMQSLAQADRNVMQALQVTKQFPANGLHPRDNPTPSALHASIGFEREISRAFVLSANFAYRHFIHLAQGSIDMNRFNSLSGPVIPVCDAIQRNDPQAHCSLGPIAVWPYAGRATYKGLLLRANQRLSHGFQFLGSYAYSSMIGNNTGNGFNLYDWLQNVGPLPTDFTHIVNLAGTAALPWRLELGLNFSYSSAPPLSAYVGGIDLNGDGTTGDLLPGTTVNALNRGIGRPDLEERVAQFNGVYAGTRDARGRAIPRLRIPGRYVFGDSLNSLDLRLSRSFAFHERWSLSLIGEVFNLYNSANLSGHTGDLTSTAFGQPTSRGTQVFGSGGPRAVQVAIRLSF
jgi:hypothetical protein